MLLACVYSPPDDSLYRFTKDELIAVVQYLNERSTAYHIFCYGDFNLKEIAWDTMDSDDEQQKLFVEKLFQNNLQQHVTFFTRGTSLLDLLITSSNVKVGDVSKFTRKVSPKSDHVPISCNIFLSQDNFLYKETSRPSFSFCRADYKSMSSFVIENPFRIQCWSNPSVLAYYWQEWLLGVVAEFVPRRTIQRSHLNPWVSAVSSHLMKRINTLEKRSNIPTAKSLELKSQLNMNLDQDMCRYQEKMSLTRSSDRLFKVFRLLRQSSLPLCCGLAAPLQQQIKIK